MAAGKQMFLALALATLVGFCSASSIIVGGSTGWTIPTSPSFYSTWASQQTFKTGDVLVFTFPAGIHTVAEVSKSAFDSCSSSNTLGPVMTTAPANITLKSAGTHFFVCTVTGHCGANQKLAVTVTGGSTSGSPTSSPSAPRPSTSRTKRASPPPAATPAATPAASPAATPVATPASAPVATPVATPTMAPSPVEAPTSEAPAAGEPTAAAGGPSSMAGEPTSGVAEPPKNSAASAAVSMLSLVSIASVALLF